MMRRTLYLLITQLLVVHAFGQKEPVFHPPVKIPIYLSGNFGEIRSDHFHSGIDIKTQGTIGIQIFSVESGYVSRIKVQANGYGKSLYVSHPNGTTSVYGHLDRYRDDIAEYVKKMQYARQSHSIDLYPAPETFPVEQGEFIAYSGNTGGSSGPHLHFEIRNSANQHPTNVLKYNFNIQEQTPPRFHSLILYPLQEDAHVNGAVEKVSSPLVKDQGVYTVPWGTRMDAAGTLGISVEVYDYLNGASNRCGIYTLEMYVDEKLSYRHVMDEFAFSETRYVNAHMDYQAFATSGAKAHRLYRLPNNRLRIYDKEAGNNAIVVDEQRKYQIRVVATDVAGNSSELRFSIQGDTLSKADFSKKAGYIKTMKYKQANSYADDQVRLDIPANALYCDMDFTFNSTPANHGSLTPFFQIASPEIPVHEAYTLSVKCPPVDASLHKKLLLISLNDQNEAESAGGDYANGSVVASLRNFGSFAIGMDTISPRISPRNGSVGGDLSGKKMISFTILDNLSGIDRYDGYIDNRWALFEYDPKNDLLVYSFDEERLIRGSEHELELYVTDSKGNVNLFHTTFTW
ncbi:MAG: M23 family metallopeptidase [Bacteroidia bacterium]|nr:MAG: M23 family metallopeptidase [Bacteroidia bacterium]